MHILSSSISALILTQVVRPDQVSRRLMRSETDSVIFKQWSDILAAILAPSWEQPGDRTWIVLNLDWSLHYPQYNQYSNDLHSIMTPVLVRGACQILVINP